MQAEQIIDTGNIFKSAQLMMEFFQCSQLVRCPQVGITNIDNRPVVGSEFAGDSFIDQAHRVASRYQAVKSGIDGQSVQPGGSEQCDDGNADDGSELVFKTCE